MRSRAWIAGALVALWAGAALAGGDDGKIAPWLHGRLAGGADESFLVLFDEPAALEAAVAAARKPAVRGAGVYEALRGRARSAQASVRAELGKAGIAFRPLYLINGLAVRGNLALARRLARHGEVVRIVGDPHVRGIDAFGTPLAAPDIGPEWGVLKIEADKVWSLDGVRGEGIVVASADTGVEWAHPALKAKYRGWNGVVANHDYNWFDAIADLPSPIDDHNHGSHTTGTMVGDDGQGNQVGVAPGARWIACRNMNTGVGQPSTYIACNQFFLAPYPHGGDPEIDGDPSKAPNIVNNSWECPPSEGCDLTVLQASFAALRAAGILSVDAAGNSGSACSTVATPPAIYDEVFVVGATDSANVLAGFSSRGPVTVDGSGRLRPDVAAPGVFVRSSIRNAQYGTFSGTSMASPHTAGAAALLWSAKPQLKGLVATTRCLISRSARGIVTLATAQVCGGTAITDRPNNMSGWGLIDAYDAIHFGPDIDTDGIADACDSCPGIANGNQADGDQDGAGDLCDCAPGNGGAFAVPNEAQNLAFGADRITLSWGSLALKAGTGTLYDVIAGDLGVLRATGTVAGAACLGVGSTATTRQDPAVPAPGAGVYYLVQGRNVCAAGGFGANSQGAQRVHASCP